MRVVADAVATPVHRELPRRAIGTPLTIRVLRDGALRDVTLVPTDAP